MIKFVTAWIDPATNEVRGVTVSDMPLAPGAEAPGGWVPQSVGAVVAREGHDTERLAPILKQHVARAADGSVSIDAAARTAVSAIYPGPSTEPDLRAAATINPAVAWWLKKRLPANAQWSAAIDQACAANPGLEAAVHAMRKRRFDPDAPVRGFAQFDQAARAATKEI